jgi:hypothetical protein
MQFDRVCLSSFTKRTGSLISSVQSGMPSTTYRLSFACGRQGRLPLVQLGCLSSGGRGARHTGSSATPTTAPAALAAAAAADCDAAGKLLSMPLGNRRFSQQVGCIEWHRPMKLLSRTVGWQLGMRLSKGVNIVAHWITTRRPSWNLFRQTIARWAHSAAAFGITPASCCPYIRLGVTLRRRRRTNETETVSALKKRDWAI